MVVKGVEVWQFRELMGLTRHFFLPLAFTLMHGFFCKF